MLYEKCDEDAAEIYSLICLNSFYRLQMPVTQILSYQLLNMCRPGSCKAIRGQRLRIALSHWKCNLQ